MTLGFDFSLGQIVQTALIGVVGFGAKEFVKAMKIIERLDERSQDHEKRLDKVERKVA